jgi:hypothetical protein
MQHIAAGDGDARLVLESIATMDQRLTLRGSNLTLGTGPNREVTAVARSLRLMSVRMSEPLNVLS